MPFANMHTQIQGLLTSYPSMTHQAMKRDVTARQTAGEYAAFMLTNMMGAWKSQVCRTMRLRHSMKSLSWKYSIVVLDPVWQPNAGQECWSKCGEKSGWCNFCGGKNRGACCKAGAAFKSPPEDPSECRQFDTPVSYWREKAQHVCVHTDCQQSNTIYKGKTISKLSEVRKHNMCVYIPIASRATQSTRARPFPS